MARSVLVDFYEGFAADFAGRRIDDIWAMSHDELEYNHDFIQWLFPLRERSGVQPNVPVLDDVTVADFDAAELRNRLLKSTRVMAEFYGFEVIEAEGKYTLRRSASFDARSRNWLAPGNHNFLRLTRIMKSLSILGLRPLAEAWLAALTSIYSERSSVIGARTFQFWKDAIAAR